MSRWVRRLFLGIAFALPLALVSFAFVQIPVQAQSGDGDDACAVCHPAFQQAWLDGAHGIASTDPVFLDAWREAGEDETCLNCHTTTITCSLHFTMKMLWQKIPFQQFHAIVNPAMGFGCIFP